MTLGKISLIGGKSDSTQQKRKNSTKSAVRTAKRPVLREKCSPKAENTSANTSKRDFGGCRHLWTAADALEAGRKGGTMKGVRAAILNDCAKTAARENRIAQIFHEAITEPDPEIANQKMQLAERAAKFIGATFDQSDEAKQKIELAGKLDNKLEVVMTKA